MPTQTRQVRGSYLESHFAGGFKAEIFQRAWNNLVHLTAYLVCDLFYYAVIEVAMGASTSLGEFEQIVLLAILRLEGEAYGVAIQAEIEDCGRRKTTPGALYTTLDRLERKGLVHSRIGESTPARGGRAKRFYVVTKEGRAQLLNAQTTFQRLLVGLDLMGGKSHA